MRNQTFHTKQNITRTALLRVVCIFLIAHSSFLIANCKSAPGVTESSLIESGFAPLDTGALAYLFIDVKQARPVLDLLPVEILNDKQTRQMVDKTSFCTVALFPEKSARRFQIVAWGNYPTFRAEMAFKFNKHWQKIKTSEESYWHSPANNLSLMLNSGQAFVVSSPSPINPATTAYVLKTPEGFSDFNRQSPVSCWIENPAPFISGLLRETGIPLQISVDQLFINLYPVSHNQCEAIIRMQFENASFARGMQALLNLAGNFSSDSILTKLLLSNPPVQNGNYLDIKTEDIKEKDISLLFEMIFVYLK
jgi:hypothetical protein